MVFLGADVAALRELAGVFASRAEQLASVADVAGDAVTTVEWSGPDAEALRERWHGEMELALRAASALLADCARRLGENAADQESTSSADDGSPAGLSGSGGPAVPGGGPGGGSTVTPPPTPEAESAPTIVATDTYTSEVSGSVWYVEGGQRVEIRVDELSDGTYRLTELYGASGGATAGTPLPYAQGTAGEYDVNGGAAVSGGAGIQGNVGVEYMFSSQEEVDAFVAYQQRQTMHGVGINRFDTYDPPEPTAVIFEAGEYGSGAAGAAVPTTVVPLVGGHAEVQAEGLAGVRYDEGAGTTTVYVRGDATAEISGQAFVPGDGEVGGPGVVAVTYDSQGNVVPNPPSSLVAAPAGGETETISEAGGSVGVSLPVVGGAGASGGFEHERTEYPAGG